jgi:hypothetical protein
MKIGWSLINSERYFLFFLTDSLYGKKGSNVLLVSYIRFKASQTFHLKCVRNENIHKSHVFLFCTVVIFGKCRHGKRERPSNKNNIIPDISDPLSNFSQPDSLASLINTRKFRIIKGDPTPRISCLLLFYLFSDVTKGDQRICDDRFYVCINQPCFAIRPRRGNTFNRQMG